MSHLISQMDFGFSKFVAFDFSNDTWFPKFVVFDFPNDTRVWFPKFLNFYYSMNTFFPSLLSMISGKHFWVSIFSHLISWGNVWFPKSGHLIFCEIILNLIKQNYMDLPLQVHRCTNYNTANYTNLSTMSISHNFQFKVTIY